MKNLTKSKQKHKLTESELWQWICSLPLSPAWQQRLDRLFDKIEQYFVEPTAKERAGKKKMSRKTEI